MTKSYFVSKLDKEAKEFIPRKAAYDIMKIFMLLLSILFFGLPGIGQTISTISGELKNHHSDSIKCIVTFNDITGDSRVYYIPLTDGRFDFQLTLKEISQITITDGVNYINGFLEPNENLFIRYNKDSLSTSLAFEGKAKSKFELIYSLNQAKIYNRIKEQVLNARSKNKPYDYIFNFIDSVETVFLERLNRNKLTQAGHMRLSGLIKGMFLNNKYRSVGMIYHESITQTLNKRKDELTPTSESTIRNFLTFDETYYTSTAYANSIYNILFMDYDSKILENERSTNLIDKYTYLRNLLPSKLRMPVLTLFLENDIEKTNQGEDIEKVIDLVYENVSGNIYKDFIWEKYQSVSAFKKGIQAADFSLENESGEKVNLISFKGKVIYIDFWYATCGPCHALFKQISPAKEHFKNNDNIIFLYISIDSKKQWKDALLKYKIPGYHVFTENKGQEHQVIKDYRVKAYPTTFLIDRNGKIAFANPSRDPSQLIREIENTLQF